MRSEKRQSDEFGSAKIWMGLNAPDVFKYYHRITCRMRLNSIFVTYTWPIEEGEYYLSSDTWLAKNTPEL